jgi:CDP-6-deoxy-D-xylo-4-hexulose-3-dehydrase
MGDSFLPAVAPLAQALASEAGAYFEQQARPAPFVAGLTYIPPSGKVIGMPEITNGVLALLDGHLTEGRWTNEFEARLAETLGTRHASLVNSGSSANLLAIAALKSKDVNGWMRMMEGGGILTAAVGFPTTLNAILLNNYRPAFVDVQMQTYVPSADDIIEACEQWRDIRVVFMAHTLGNPLPLDIVERLGKLDVVLIEDNCDALGSRFRGKPTGTFGLAGTQSFYPAHHITTGEGGAVVTRSPSFKKAVERLRDWGRDCWCEPGKENTCGKRFDWDFDGLPHGYDHKYVYSAVGYNLKSTDLQAAIGLAQLDRLKGFVDARRAHFSWLHNGLQDMEEHLMLPRKTEESQPAWFGFPLTIRHGERADLIRFLDERRIGTRLMFGGNLLRQPAYAPYVAGGFWRTLGDLRHSDTITDRTFWVGCWPGMSKPMIDFIVESLHDFFGAKVR